MLKGSSKAVQAENARTMRRQGMTEKERALASMKRTKKEQTAEMPIASGSSDAYPYGLRLDLSESELSKLNLDEMPSVGEELDLTAKAKVTRVEQSSSDTSGDRKGLTLQITDLHLGSDSDSDQDD